MAGERRPDGEYEYQVVVVSVPRQTGKTTLVRAEGVHSCLVCGQDFFYTAQTGKDARERWMDLVKVLRVNDALAGRFTIGLRGGSEHVTFADGGAFRVFAPTPESLHGYTPHKVAIDEAFAQSPEAGELLMGAIGPAQFTIIDKQLWIISTAGTAESSFLHDWIDRAAEGMPRVALFLWACPDDLDPFSLEDIPKFHPGVGFELNGKTLTAEDVLSQADRLSRAEYERAFGNRRTLTTSHLIPTEAWRALHDKHLTAPGDTSRLMLSYDVAADRRGAAILATWMAADGRPRTKVVRTDTGTDWLAAEVADLWRAWRPAQVVAVGNGPVLDATAQLRRLGVDVTELGERDYAAACGAFLTLVEDRGFGHDGAEVLERSATGLVTRAAAVDGVAFSRRHSVGNAAPAIAAAIGLWAARTQPAGRPVLYFAGA